MANFEANRITLSGMDLQEFAIRAGDKRSEEAFQINQRVNIEHSIDSPFILVSLRLTCKQVSEDTSAQTAEGSFHLRFIFNVKKLDEMMYESDTNPYPIVHPQLAATLTSIAYSTARGLLWARTVGTPLEGFVLPIVDPLKLLIDSSTADNAEKEVKTVEQ